MEKKDKLFISIYNDYYSGILTEYQSSIIKMYYDEDLSLGEIAERLNITPQGVRDALKRAEKTLIEMEQKLGLVKKSEKVKIKNPILCIIIFIISSCMLGYAYYLVKGGIEKLTNFNMIFIPITLLVI